MSFGSSDSEHRVEIAIGERHQAAPVLGRLGRVGTRMGVEQREPPDTLRARCA